MRLFYSSTRSVFLSNAVFYSIHLTLLFLPSSTPYIYPFYPSFIPLIFHLLPPLFLTSHTHLFLSPSTSSIHPFFLLTFFHLASRTSNTLQLRKKQTERVLRSADALATCYVPVCVAKGVGFDCLLFYNLTNRAPLIFLVKGIMFTCLYT